MSIMCVYEFLDEYGRREAILFFIYPSYWRKPSRIKPGHMTPHEPSLCDRNNVENVSNFSKMVTALEICHLSKVFNHDSQPVQAINDLSICMYESEITAVLGHNGAGKTTLINIITGLMLPTRGKVFVYGRDVSELNSMQDVWNMIGICPQEDVLVPVLTPREHLEYIASIRGVCSKKLNYEVDRMLSDVCLLEKADELSEKLSGGQKRKLSVVQALIGSPKIIVLDEPTAGLDPYSRRHMWNFLTNAKQNKLVLLTTHFMDEADILADRKAVIISGSLICYGSSIYLKNRFGVGYHLIMICGNCANISQIDKFIKDRIPSASSGRRHGNELSYVLPTNTIHSFSALFTSLEKNLHVLNIHSFGLSLTSLEEVFLRLTNSTDVEESKNEVNVDSAVEIDSNPTTSNDEIVKCPTVDINYSTWKTISALLRIRWLNLIRVPSQAIMLFVLPFALIAFSVYMNKLSVEKHSVFDHRHRISANLYASNDIILINSNVNSSFYRTFVHHLGLTPVYYDGNYTALLNYSSALSAMNVVQMFDANTSQAKIDLVLQDHKLYSHSVLVNLINNALIWSINNIDPPISSINTYFHQLPGNFQDQKLDPSVITSIFIFGFVFLLMPNFVVSELSQERQLMIRNQLRVNGVTFTSYILSYAIFYVTIMLIQLLICVLCVLVMNVESLVSGPAMSMFVAIYFEYCFVAFATGVMFSYLFKTVESSQTFYPIISMFCGFISFMIIIIMDTLALWPDTTIQVHYVMVLFNPFYTPNGLLYFILKKHMMVSALPTKQLEYKHFWMDKTFTVTLICQPIQFFLLMLITSYLDNSNFRSYFSAKSEEYFSRFFSRIFKFGTKSDCEENDCGSDYELISDDDVLQEKHNVKQLFNGKSILSPVIYVYRITKNYCDSFQYCSRKKRKINTAVNDVNFMVDAGEVFGLLGPNGAGKTTILKAITAETHLTDGYIKIGQNTAKHRNSLRNVGYCPQFDALWKNITVAEHLKFWAHIRGVHSSQVQLLVKYYLKGLKLIEHTSKRTCKCSGGTKRKLSYAISMLGRPSIVLLDEPSTGMDPQSKRFLWNTVNAAFLHSHKKGAVLTTHSMEEADALCSRVAIMTSGQLRCIGSSQHLKNKYGNGYMLELKMRNDMNLNRAFENIDNLVRGLFPQSIIEEHFGERVRYRIPFETSFKLSEIFLHLEQGKQDMAIEAYNLSQTTLEQVFLRFASKQTSEIN